MWSCLTSSEFDPEPDSDDSEFEDDPESSGLAPDDDEDEDDYENASSPSGKRRSTSDGDKRPKRRKVDEVCSIKVSIDCLRKSERRARDQLDYPVNSARSTLRG
jgi:hypothetical protein